MRNLLHLQTNLIHFLKRCNPLSHFLSCSSHVQGFDILFSYRSCDPCLYSMSQSDLPHLSQDLIAIFQQGLYHLFHIESNLFNFILLCPEMILNLMWQNHTAKFNQYMHRVKHACNAFEKHVDTRILQNTFAQELLELTHLKCVCRHPQAQNSTHHFTLTYINMQLDSTILSVLICLSHLQQWTPPTRTGLHSFEHMKNRQS